MSLYARILRPLLFRLDAEAAHHWTIQACHWGGWLASAVQRTGIGRGKTHPELSMSVGGLNFANPVGLAAGWDKSGRALRILNQLGLGFAEIGSISALPSRGNPRPRLFRLPADRGIVVNYGLPNDGAQVVARRLATYRPQIPLGINVVTTNHGSSAGLCDAKQILDDYARSVGLLHSHASYLTLNLSCPNAADGKDFFETPGRIAELLERLSDQQLTCPVFLKVPPSDLAADHERWLSEVADFDFVRGFIFNLAPGKPAWLGMRSPPEVWQRLPGAVSGAPVASHMDRCIANLYARMDRRRYAIIGSGGIFNADDAWRKICLGASLIQIYTALVFEGPGVIARINAGLLQRLRHAGWEHLSQAVGCGSSDLQIDDQPGCPSLPPAS